MKLLIVLVVGSSLAWWLFNRLEARLARRFSSPSRPPPRPAAPLPPPDRASKPAPDLYTELTEGAPSHATDESFVGLSTIDDELTGGGPTLPDEEPGEGPDASAGDRRRTQHPSDPVDALLQQLRSSDAAEQIEGLDGLDGLRLDRDGALRVLWAAGGELPLGPDPDVPIAQRLLEAAEPWLAEDDVGLLRSIYPRLPDGGRRVALRLLGGLGTEAAAGAWAESLARHGGVLGSSQTRGWNNSLAHGAALFPTALDGDLSLRSTRALLLLALHYLEEGALPEHALPALRNATRRLWRQVAEELGEGRSDEPWRWSDDYVAARRAGGLALDLAGRFEDAASAKLVRAALTSVDPRIRLLAVSAALRRGLELSAEDVGPAGDAPETRRELYLLLRGAKKSSLMPRAQRSQEAMAEADLARWLARADALGHPPDAIEAVDVVTDGGVDWHLFRFRSGSPRWADAGWMAGVSGPWTRKDGPAGTPAGGTTSAFSSWDDQSAEAHLAELRDASP